MITFDLIPASYGDTILISVVPQEGAETHILVDCGMKYAKNILPVIKNLKKKGKQIDRFIVTHYDNDHIQSAARFIKENGKYNEPKIIPVEQVWLNTYRHLQTEKNLAATAARDETELQEYIELNDNFIDPEEENEINARQASFLGKELLAGAYPWNKDFGKKAACIENGRAVMISDQVKLTLLSPTAKALEDLKAAFEEMMKYYKIAISNSELIDDAYELFLKQGGRKEDLLEGYEISGNPEITAEVIRKMSDGSGYDPDTAPGNGSSIAFILEADDKRILMLADAHAETIMEQLKLVYGEEQGYPLYFDAVKVAHHGSYRNNSPKLFELIDSPKFMFSTNGLHQSHVHPDLQTIALIINRKLTHGIKQRELIFNHELKHLEGLQQQELMDEFNYMVKLQNFVALP